MSKIFLSFRRWDTTAIAGRIYDRVSNTYGKTEVANDIGYIPAASDPRTYVADTIRQFSVLLVLIGPNWLTLRNRNGQRRLDLPDDVVRLEIEAALRFGVPIVPLLVQAVPLPPEEQLPDGIKPLARIEALQFRAEENFNGDMRRLYKVLEQQLAQHAQRQTPGHVDGTPPVPARVGVLRTNVAHNKERGKPPYAEIQIKNLGELNWILREQTGELGQGRRRPADLREADLSYANLTGAVLDSVNLSSANLEGANLSGSNLTDAHLNDANLSRADLSRAVLDAADLSGARLDLAVLSRARLVGSKLNELELHTAKLDGADLTGADLQAADLHELDFTGAVLSNTLLERANLRNAGLAGATLTQAKLGNAQLEEADLSGAHVEQAVLSSSDLTGANLSGAYLSDADLSAANLRATNLSAARLERADLTSAVFDETDLNRAVLDRTKLDAVEDILSKIKFGPDAQLDKVAWSGVEVSIEVKGQSREKKLAAYRDIARVNRRIAIALRGLGLQAEAARYRLQEQRMQRKILRHQGKIGQWLFSWLLNITAGYGEKPWRSLVSYLAVVLAFGTACFTLTNYVAPSPNPLAWYEALVLSISSFHGRGFVPSTVSLGDPLAMFAAAEAVIGLFIELIFIATFSRRFLGN